MFQLTCYSKDFLISVIQADKSLVTKGYKSILSLKINNDNLGLESCLRIGTDQESCPCFASMRIKMSDSDKFGHFLGRQNMDNCLTENDVLLLLIIINLIIQGTRLTSPWVA